MKKKCKKCGSENKIHIHHITYEPEETIQLCKRCHKVITNINTLIARRYNEMKPLTNDQRLKLHDFFMASEIWILKSIVAPHLLRLDDKPKKKKKKQKLPKGEIIETYKYHNWHKIGNHGDVIITKYS